MDKNQKILSFFATIRVEASTLINSLQIFIFCTLALPLNQNCLCDL